MKNLLTQVNLAPSGGYQGIGSGPLANPNAGNPIGIFAKFISSVIGVMTIVAIIWFIFTLISGAIGMISSGGDKGQTENAKKKITTGIIGLVITILAIFIISLIGTFLGIPNILDFGALFNTLL